MYGILRACTGTVVQWREGIVQIVQLPFSVSPLGNAGSRNLLGEIYKKHFKDHSEDISNDFFLMFIEYTCTFYKHPCYIQRQ